MIAVPCMDMMHTQFVKSLVGMRVEGEVDYAFSAGSLVYDSRNRLAERAENGGFDRVLWLDSDMVFGPDLLEKLGADLAEGRELVAALFTTRKPPVKLGVCSSLGIRTKNGVDQPVAVPFETSPDEIFPVEGVGLGAVLMSAKILREVTAAFGRPFSPVGGFGEDYSFCLRARRLGYQLWCDPAVRVGHIGLRVFSPEDIGGE